MRFFAAIRYILAQADGVDLFNAAAHDTIEKHIIPILNRQARKGVKGAEELVDMYKDYLRGSRSRIFGVQAFKAIRQVAGRYNFAEEDLDELISKLFEDYYRRKSWKALIQDKKRWTTIILRGPEAFASWFTNVVRLAAMSNARDISYHYQHEKSIEPEEEDDSNPIERIEDEGGDPLDALVEKEVQQELSKYIKREFSNKPVHMKLFEAWMEGLKRQGAGLNLRQKILKPLSDKLGVPEGTLYHNVGELKKAIAQFFAREYGVRVRANVTGSIEQVLTYTEYRRRIAAWVLPKSEVLRRLLLR